MLALTLCPGRACEAATLPLLHPVADWVSASHARACAQVLGLTGNVRKMFRDMDEGLYEECRQQYEAAEVRDCSPSNSFS